MRRPWQLITGFTVMLTLMVSLFPPLAPFFSLGPDLHVILGGALSFIIVFRAPRHATPPWTPAPSTRETGPPAVL